MCCIARCSVEEGEWRWMQWVRWRRWGGRLQRSRCKECSAKENQDQHVLTCIQMGCFFNLDEWFFFQWICGLWYYLIIFVCVIIIVIIIIYYCYAQEISNTKVFSGILQILQTGFGSFSSFLYILIKKTWNYLKQNCIFIGVSVTFMHYKSGQGTLNT